MSRTQFEELLETEGTVQNGGGNFQIVRPNGSNETFVKWTRDELAAPAQAPMPIGKGWEPSGGLTGLGQGVEVSQEQRDDILHDPTWGLKRARKPFASP